MKKFANQDLSWLNHNVKNLSHNIKEKIISRYLENQSSQKVPKSTDINVLLNRVKLDQKKESRKKILFSTAATAGVLVFGILIF